MLAVCYLSDCHVLRLLLAERQLRKTDVLAADECLLRNLLKGYLRLSLILPAPKSRWKVDRSPHQVVQ